MSDFKDGYYVAGDELEILRARIADVDAENELLRGHKDALIGRAEKAEAALAERERTIATLAAVVDTAERWARKNSFVSLTENMQKARKRADLRARAEEAKP